MGKRSRKTSTHLSLLLFAQNTWSLNNKNNITARIHNMLNTHTASFLIGTTDHKNEQCIICSQLYDLLKKIQGKSDGRLFISHNILDTFYIWDPHQRNEVIEFTHQIFQEKCIKKFYILQIDSFSEHITQTKDFSLVDLISHDKIPKNRFVEILDQGIFKANILYEIVRDSYS